MPELPEVEFARRLLDGALTGKRIVLAQVIEKRILRGHSSPAAVGKFLVGHHVEAVERRGKWLRIALDSGAALFSHLGMTGKWERHPTSAPSRPYERARIDLGKTSVRYLDPRMFGTLAIDPPRAWSELGPDPLGDRFDAQVLTAAVGHVKKTIKEALLDQARVAGLGNIQAAESLWRAQIHPQRRAASLTPPELARLARAIAASLRFTLALSPADEIAYVEERGAPNPFRVYGQQGRPCPRCKTTLERIVQAGRSTVYCPHCQKIATPKRGGARTAAPRKPKR